MVHSNRSDKCTRCSSNYLYGMSDREEKKAIDSVTRWKICEKIRSVFLHLACHGSLSTCILKYVATYMYGKTSYASLYVCNWNYLSTGCVPRLVLDSAMQISINGPTDGYITNTYSVFYWSSLSIFFFNFKPFFATWPNSFRAEHRVLFFFIPKVVKITIGWFIHNQKHFKTVPRKIFSLYYLNCRWCKIVFFRIIIIIK